MKKEKDKKNGPGRTTGGDDNVLMAQIKMKNLITESSVIGLGFTLCL